MSNRKSTERDPSDPGYRLVGIFAEIMKALVLRQGSNYAAAQSLAIKPKQFSRYLKPAEHPEGPSLATVGRIAARFDENVVQLFQRHPYLNELSEAVGAPVFRPAYCQRCAKDCKPHGHHFNGYEGDNALKVIWLCPSCHRNEHVKES